MSGLPNGWAATTLGRVIALNYGKSLPAPERDGGQYTVFGSNGIVGRHSQAITNAPAIVVGRKGSFGEVHFSDIPCFPIDTTYYVDSFDILNARFAYHLLRHLPLKEMNRASAIPGLNREDAYSLDVGLPPLPEQQLIAAKVDELTARTARARKELDRIPTLIARYKQRLLALAFSEERAVNWPQKLIDEISTIVTSGSRGWAQYYSSDGDLFIRVGNVRRLNIELDLNDIQCVNPPPGAEGIRTQLQDGDVLITITADLGRVGVFSGNQTAYVNQHVALVRLDDSTQSRFVGWYLSSELGQSQLFENNRGATKAGLGLGDIKGVAIPLPDPEEQAEIVRRIESAFGWLNRMAADHVASVRLLPKLDAAILTKAFRGELAPQDPNDEPASMLLHRIRAQREAEAKKPKSGRGRKPHGSKEKLMTEKPLPPRDRLMNDSAKWPTVGLPFEAIAIRNAMPHDALRDALFELLSGPSPALQQRFDTDAEVMVIQRVAA